MKLEAEKNPFQLGAKRFHSEELQRAHQEHIARLETLLEEKNKTSTIMVSIKELNFTMLTHFFAGKRKIIFTEANRKTNRY